MRKFRLKLSPWFYPILGGLLGLLYVLIDEGILDEMTTTNVAVLILHEFVDAIFPVLFGVSVGFGFYSLKKQSRLNTFLSLKKERLQKDLLFSTLISQILHEIQNPLHNISAAFQDGAPLSASEKEALIKRNLERLSELKKRYGQWGSLLEKVNPEEPLLLKPWLENIMEDKFLFQFRKLRIHYTQDISPVRVFVHPLLIEQALQTLFTNLIEALEPVDIDKRRIILRVRPNPENVSEVLLMVRNSGSSFPGPVLEAQGKKPVESRHGLGLGLLLLNKTVEQVGGRMVLTNADGGACVTLLLPGEAV